MTDHRRRRPPGHGEARIRIETTDAAASEQVLAALTEAFGAAAVDEPDVFDRSRPRRGRAAVPGLEHRYLTVTVHRRP